MLDVCLVLRRVRSFRNLRFRLDPRAYAAVAALSPPGAGDRWLPTDARGRAATAVHSACACFRPLTRLLVADADASTTHSALDAAHPPPKGKGRPDPQATKGRDDGSGAAGAGPAHRCGV